MGQRSLTRLSCHRFLSNEVRLWLSLIAYNLGNLWRRLVLPKKIENWSLTQLAAAAGEDGWAVGETCSALLAPVGRGPSDAPGAILRRIWALPLPVG